MIANCGAESVVSDVISVQVWSIKEEARMVFIAGGDKCLMEAEACRSRVISHIVSAD